MVAVVQVVLYGGVMQCRVVSPLLQWLVLRRKPRTFLAVQMGSFANFSPLPYLSSFFSLHPHFRTPNYLLLLSSAQFHLSLKVHKKFVFKARNDNTAVR